MSSTRKPTSSTSLLKVAATSLAVLLALAAAAQGRSLAGPVQHTAHTDTVAAQPLPKPEIRFFPERGCGGLVDVYSGCEGCIPIPATQGYLVTFTDPGQSAVFYSGARCTGREMAKLLQNSCFCSTAPPYRSVRLECGAVGNNATAVVGHEYSEH